MSGAGLGSRLRALEGNWAREQDKDILRRTAGAGMSKRPEKKPAFSPAASADVLPEVLAHFLPITKDDLDGSKAQVRVTQTRRKPFAKSPPPGPTVSDRAVMESTLRLAAPAFKTTDVFRSAQDAISAPPAPIPWHRVRRAPAADPALVAAGAFAAGTALCLAGACAAFLTLKFACGIHTTEDLATAMRARVPGFAASVRDGPVGRAAASLADTARSALPSSEQSGELAAALARDRMLRAERRDATAAATSNASSGRGDSPSQ